MHKEIKTFEGDMYLQDGLVWTNISNKKKTGKEREYYIKGMVRNDLAILRSTDMRNINDFEVNSEYNLIMQTSHYNNNVTPEDINTDIIQMRDGHLDLITGDLVKNDWGNIQFTPYQIPLGIKEEISEDKKKLVDRFFRKVSDGDEDFEKGLLEIIGSTMAPRNDSIMPILYSPHKSSGKGTIMEIISNINCKTREIKGENWWGQGNQFSLGSTRNQLTAWIDEVPSVLPESSTEKIKSAADSKRFMEIERKGVDQEKVLNTPTFIATTNNHVEFYSIDDSLKGRVMWFSFKMNLDGKMAFSKQEIAMITKDKECLEYIATRALKAYSEVVKRTGSRNEVFTKPKCHFDFWNSVSILNKGVEIIESDMVLAALWDSRQNFFSNADLKAALESYKIKNKDERITFRGLQSEIIAYVHSNKLGICEKGKNNKDERGIKIVWAKKAQEYNDSYNQMMEEQAALSLAVEENVIRITEEQGGA